MSGLVLDVNIERALALHSWYNENGILCKWETELGLIGRHYRDSTLSFVQGKIFYKSEIL